MRTRRASIDRDRVLINVLCYSIIVALFVACIRYVDKNSACIECNKCQ